MNAARIKALAGATILAMMSVSLSAHASETTLTVSAAVLKHASMQVVAQPDSVVVTAEDIARGYVDVPGTAKITVQSNTQGGYLLHFARLGDFFRQALVRGLAGPDLQLEEGGGAVAQASTGQGMTRTALDLAFRFVLSESARQGVYSWPVRLSVAPL